MVKLYFDCAHRTMVSQSKKNYVFATPDWSLLEPYLFPWIRSHTFDSVGLARNQIKHVAFRIWEYLTTEGRIVTKYEEEQGHHRNVPLGDVRAWWLQTDGKFPPNYEAWSHK